MKPLTERIQSVETLLGAKLPDSYRTFLLQPFAQPVDLLTFPCDGSQFTVQDFLRIDDGADYLQLDCTFERVRHALPKGMIPFAADIAGNYYCIVLSEAKVGRVVWWDHEREVGAEHVEDVAASFDDFMRSLTVFPDHEA